MTMELNPTDGNGFHMAALRIISTIVTIFLATYLLATISAGTGDIIQDLLSRPRCYDTLLDLEQESSPVQTTPLYAAIATATAHTIFICYPFLAGNENFSTSAIARYAEGVCIVLLAVETIAMLVMAVFWLFAKGVQWYVDTRRLYAAWWEGDGIYD